jgi:hypothetical protein
LGQLIRDHGGPAREACVLSPFFDICADSGAYPITDELLGALAERGTRDIDYVVGCEELPDGRIRLQAPKSLIREGKKPAEYYIWPVKEEVDGEFRPLHAKSVWLWNDNWHVYMIGSSNFTRAGLGLAKGASNFEADLAYVFRSRGKFENIMEETLPPYGDRLTDLDKVIWDAVDERAGEYAITAALLPTGFEEALFEPQGDGAVLQLSFGSDLPQDWTVSFKAGSVVFSSSGWRQAGSPPTALVPWGDKAIPNVLDVQWTDDAQQKQTARWPVNVTDPGQLPPPDALRNLSLQTLLEILCSNRPLHEALGSSRATGNGACPNGDVVDELDPLKRISSETFLLQRTRRVAKAIDQLVQTLSKPVVHPDALAWRLRGPVGPCALAKAICRESRTSGEACFLLSEIVLVLRRLDTSKIAVGVQKSEVDAALGETISAIHSMVSEQLECGDVPASMTDYISAALQQG